MDNALLSDDELVAIGQQFLASQLASQLRV